MNGDFLKEFYDRLTTPDSSGEAPVHGMPEYDVFRERVKTSIQNNDGFLNEFHKRLEPAVSGLPDYGRFESTFRDYFSDELSEPAVEPTKPSESPKPSPVLNAYTPKERVTELDETEKITIPEVDFHQFNLGRQEFNHRVNKDISIFKEGFTGTFGLEEETLDRNNLALGLVVDAIQDVETYEGKVQPALEGTNESQATTILNFYGINNEENVGKVIANGFTLGEVTDEVREAYNYVKENQGRFEDPRDRGVTRKMQAEMGTEDPLEYDREYTQYQQSKRKVANFAESLLFQADSKKNKEAMREVYANSPLSREVLGEDFVDRVAVETADRVTGMVGQLTEDNQNVWEVVAMYLDQNPNAYERVTEEKRKLLAKATIPVSTEVDEDELQEEVKAAILTNAAKYAETVFENDARIIEARYAGAEDKIKELNSLQAEIKDQKFKYKGQEYEAEEYFNLRMEEVENLAMNLGGTVGPDGSIAFPVGVGVSEYEKITKSVSKELEEYQTKVDKFNQKVDNVGGYLGWGEDWEGKEKAISDILSSPASGNILKSLSSGFAGMASSVTGAYAHLYNINSPKFREWQDQALDLQEIAYDLKREAGFAEWGDIKDWKDAKNIGSWAIGTTFEMIPIVGSFIAAGYIGAKTGGAVGGGRLMSSMIASAFTNAWGTATYAGDIYNTAAKEGVDPIEARNTAVQYALPASLASTVVPTYVGTNLAKVMPPSWTKQTVLDMFKAAGVSIPAESMGERIAAALTIAGERAMGLEVTPEEARSRLNEATAAAGIMGLGMGPMAGHSANTRSLSDLVSTYVDQVREIDAEVGDNVALRAMSEQVMGILQKNKEGLSAEGKAVLNYLENLTTKKTAEGKKIKSSEVEKGHQLLAKKAAEVFNRSGEENQARYLELAERNEHGILTFEEAAELMALWGNDNKAVQAALDDASLKTIYQGREASLWKRGDWVTAAEGALHGKVFEIKSIDAKTGEMQLRDVDGNDITGTYVAEDLKKGYKVSKEVIEGIKARQAAVDPKSLRTMDEGVTEGTSEGAIDGATDGAVDRTSDRTSDRATDRAGEDRTGVAFYDLWDGEVKKGERQEVPLTHRKLGKGQLRIYDNGSVSFIPDSGADSLTLGKIDDIFATDLSVFGFEGPANVTARGEYTYTVEGDVYEVSYTDPSNAITYDDEGNLVSVEVDKVSKKGAYNQEEGITVERERTFLEGASAEEVALQIELETISKRDGGQQLNEAVTQRRESEMVPESAQEGTVETTERSEAETAREPVEEAPVQETTEESPEAPIDSADESPVESSPIVTREQGGKTHEYQKQEDGTWVNVKYPDRVVKSERIINELEQSLKAPKEVSSPAVESQTEQTTDEAVTQTTTEETPTQEVAGQKQAKDVQVQTEEGDVSPRKTKAAKRRKTETKKERQGKREEVGLKPEQKPQSKATYEKGDTVTAEGSDGVWKVASVGDGQVKLIRPNAPGILSVSVDKVKKLPKDQVEAPEKPQVSNFYGKLGSKGKMRNLFGIALSLEEIAQLKAELPKVFEVLRKALSQIAPETKFVTHDSQEGFLRALPEEQRAAAQGTNAYYSNGEVHILLNDKLQFNTAWHEAIHPVLNAVKENNPKLYEEIVEGIHRRLSSDSDNSPYVEFGQSYEDASEMGKKEEAVIEFLSDLAADRFDVSQNMVWWERLLGWIKNKLFGSNTFTIDGRRDIMNVGRELANAMADGKVIVIAEAKAEAEGFSGKQSEPQFQKQGADAKKQRVDKAKERLNDFEDLKRLTSYPTDTNTAFYLVAYLDNLKGDASLAANEFLDAYRDMDLPPPKNGDEFIQAALVHGAEWADVNPTNPNVPTHIRKMVKDFAINEGIWDLKSQLMKGEADYASAALRLYPILDKAETVIPEFTKGVENQGIAGSVAQFIVDEIFKDYGSDTVGAYKAALETATMAWKDAPNSTAMIHGGTAQLVFDKLLQKAEIDKGDPNLDVDVRREIINQHFEILQVMKRLEVFGGRFNAAVNAGALEASAVPLVALHDLMDEYRAARQRVVQVEDKDGNKVDRVAEEALREEVSRLRSEMAKLLDGAEMDKVAKAATGVMKAAKAATGKMKTPKTGPTVKPSQKKISSGRARIKKGVNLLKGAVQSPGGLVALMVIKDAEQFARGVKEIFLGTLEVTSGNIQKARGRVVDTLTGEGIGLSEKEASKHVEDVVRDNEEEIREVMVAEFGERLSRASGSKVPAIKSVISRLLAAATTDKAKTKTEKLKRLVENHDLLIDAVNVAKRDIHSNTTLSPAQRAERINVLNDLVGRQVDQGQMAQDLLKGAVREGYEQLSGEALSTKIKKIVRDFYTREDNIKTLSVDLAEHIVKELGVTAETATKMADAIKGVIRGKITTAAESWVNRTLTPRDSNRVRRTKLEQMAEVVLAGGLTDGNMAQLFYEKFNIPPMSQEQIEDLTRLSREFQQSPPGIRRNQAQRELATYMYHLKDRSALESFMNVYRDIYYVNILSGMLTTGMRNVFGPLYSMVFEFMIPDLVRDPVKFARFWQKALLDFKKTDSKGDLKVGGYGINFPKLGKLAGAGVAVVPDVMSKGHSDQLYAETPPEQARALDTWTNSMGDLYRSWRKGNWKDFAKLVISARYIMDTYATRANMVMDNLITPFMFEYESYMNAYDRAKKERKTRRGKWIPIGKEFNQQLDELLAIDRMDTWSSQLKEEVKTKIADGEISDTKYGRSKYTAMRMKELVMEARDEDLRVASERAARSVTLLNSPHGYIPAFAYNLYNKGLRGSGYDSTANSLLTASLNAVLLLNLPIVRVPLNMSTFMYQWTPIHGAELATKAFSDKFLGTDSYGKIITKATPSGVETQDLAPHQIGRRETKAFLGMLSFLFGKLLFFKVDDDDPYNVYRTPLRPDIRITGNWDPELASLPGWRPNSLQVKEDGEWKTTMSLQDSPYLFAVTSGIGRDFNEYYKKRDQTQETVGFDPAIMVQEAMLESFVMLQQVTNTSFMEGAANIIGAFGLGSSGNPVKLYDPELGTGIAQKAFSLVGGRYNDPFASSLSFLTPNFENQAYKVYKQMSGGDMTSKQPPKSVFDLKTYTQNAVTNTFLENVLPWSFEPVELPEWRTRTTTGKVSRPIKHDAITINRTEALDPLGFPLPVEIKAPYTIFQKLEQVRDDGEMMYPAERMRQQSEAHRMVFDGRLDANVLPRTYRPNRDLTGEQEFGKAVKDILRKRGKDPKLKLTAREQHMISETYKNIFGELLNTEVRSGNLRNWERYYEDYDRTRSVGARDAALDYVKNGVNSVHNEATELAKQYYLEWLKVQD